MPALHKTRLSALVTVLTLAVLAPVAAVARAQTAAAPPAATLLQVDGITNRTIDKLWDRTDYYWHDGDYNRIVGLIRVVIEADPEFYEAYSVGAWLLWSMGDKPASNRLLDLGVQKGKNKWMAQYNFGELLFVRREFKDAIPHLNFAIQHANAPAQAWKMLAHSYEKTGDVKKSAELWRTVVKRFPNDQAGPSNLARVEKKLQGG
jgi:hypothetical protein